MPLRDTNRKKESVRAVDEEVCRESKKQNVVEVVEGIPRHALCILYIMACM